MSENTKIEWCDHTFNPWEGCTKVGPGCDNCYAEARNARFSGGQAINWGPGAPRRRTSAANWQLPLKWNRQFELRQAAWDTFVLANPGMTDEQLLAAGFRQPKRPRVFCASLADVFDNHANPQWRADLFALILKTPNLDWLLLTKRIGNVADMVEEACDLHTVPQGYQSLWAQGEWPANVWLGATIVNQAEADRDIPKLLAVPATTRFLSMEPLLGPVTLRNSCIGKQSTLHRLWGIHPDDDHFDALHPALRSRIDWVISGGESGPGARALHPDWERSLRDQCKNAGVPFNFKQWGEWIPYEDSAQPPYKYSQHGDEIDGHILPDFESEEGQKQREWHCDWSNQILARRVGKKAAGRLLDGVEHNGFPE